MRKKTELYPKQQEELIEKIIKILELDEEDSIVLHHLDNDTEKINKLMELIPELRMYFAFSKIVGLNDPDQVKRPYLSLIKMITKSKYRMFKSDFRIITETGIIRTKKYTFIKKCLSEKTI